MAARVTRSQSRDVNRQHHTSTLTSRVSSLPDIETLPSTLNVSNTGLKNKLLRLLLLKQGKLADPDGQIPRLVEDGAKEPKNVLLAALMNAAQATLVFGQEEAGTAVCVSAIGLLLTCSHCVGESADASEMAKDHWLLFADGRIVKARCVAWDGGRDLALLRIVAAQVHPGNATMNTLAGSTTPAFPAIALSEVPPKRNSALHCIGHPGSEDLEVDISGVATDYDVLHISEGRYRGLATGQDVHDNSEIGALKHDCWTYWGHSGAPLIDDHGMLVGLHSSWDDETGMRRGVAWEAVKAFLDEHGVVA
ncbi:hypothetical protein LTR97_002218 [Elasticomyces elasticus]|uniref:Serine protease n=1 Tax=Elasticomyces elasticus TaxID=574655 RepID=A0AAN7WF98_9PEZI|nr:hypothetical protein LTR97_002218 [Elasticomyces elasticus]